MDLDAGLITVRETRLDDDADPEDPKSEAGERPVALSAMLVTLLRVWRKQQLKERMAWGERGARDRDRCGRGYGGDRAAPRQDGDGEMNMFIRGVPSMC